MKLLVFGLSLLACLLSAVRSVRAETGAVDFSPVDFSPPPTTEIAATTPTAPPTVNPSKTPIKSDDAALDFAPPAPVATAPVETGLPTESIAPPATAPPPNTPPTSTQSDLAQLPADAPLPAAKQAELFEGGSRSLVARTVGHAEGNLTATGEPTSNYYGHQDPGNGVWNRGTFSYQFGNAEHLSPDQSDARQLAKIRGHYEQSVLPKAQQLGLTLTLEETLNAIDLANQAPLAVTEQGGYVERLAEAKRNKQLSGESAILESRIWSFWNPDKGRWDASGLRAYDDISKQESIRRDQDRRMVAIADALQSWQQERK